MHKSSPTNVGPRLPPRAIRSRSALVSEEEEDAEQDQGGGQAESMFMCAQPPAGWDGVDGSWQGSP